MSLWWRHKSAGWALVILLTGVMLGQAGSECASCGRRSSPEPSSNGAAVTSPCLDKSVRTPTQRKISSQLLCALYPPETPGFTKPRLRTDAKGRVRVDIRAKVTDELVARVRGLGGRIVSHSEQTNSVVAYFPLARVERLAAYPQVKFVGPATEAITNQPAH